MLFSNPDYPLFLIAVFFLYALARWGAPQLAWIRVAVVGLVGSVGLALAALRAGIFDDPLIVVFLVYALVAVVAIYAVARWAWARIAVMVLLGDVVFALVAKDPGALWDPIGGVVIRLVAEEGGWSAGEVGRLAAHWAIGVAVLAGALAVGRRCGGWIASGRGEAWIARGVVIALAAVGATVALAAHGDVLDPATAAIASYGHLVVLLVLGVAIGATREPAHRRLGRVLVLFVASALFYQAWASAMPGPYRYLLALLLGTIVLDYYLGIWIERSEAPARRKALVIVSVCSNLGVLFFFKYADFFSQDVLHLPVRRLHLILPAGISFHTFQSLSYTIDVYRRRLRATRSVISFATFVLFFPQLVAGPIVRAQDLLPQLTELPPLQLEAATAGLFRIVVGLFKKIALADTLALALVDRVFEAPERFSALEVIAAVYGYALQIYLDFSAYSDIAIGSAQVLGFTLPENFRTPYRAANLQEFWRRWHISLSTWLRDYLYITLGGSQGAPWRTYVNLSLTMLLGGLWHGASWTFVVWGALHGFGLAVTRYFQRHAEPDERGARRGGRMIAVCAGIAAIGLGLHRALLSDAGTWPQLVAAWLYLTPLWAVLTAWLSREEPAPVAPMVLIADEGLPWRALFRRDPEAPAARVLRSRLPELLRLAMCAAALGFLAALAWEPSWTWIPLIALTWALGIAADAVERGGAELRVRLAIYARRALSVVLVFQYVCLAWVFFRATSFDNALGVLRQIAGGETDHANLVPIVTVALVTGFACHLFGDGSFRWLRRRFVGLPPWAQGALLAGVALVLRELGHAKIVPFIYFQF